MVSLLYFLSLSSPLPFTLTLTAHCDVLLQEPTVARAQFHGHSQSPSADRPAQSDDQLPATSTASAQHLPDQPNGRGLCSRGPSSPPSNVHANRELPSPACPQHNRLPTTATADAPTTAATTPSTTTAAAANVPADELHNATGSRSNATSSSPSLRSRCDAIESDGHTARVHGNCYKDPGGRWIHRRRDLLPQECRLQGLNAEGGRTRLRRGLLCLEYAVQVERIEGAAADSVRTRCET